MTTNNLSRRVAITGMCAAVAVPVTVHSSSAPDAELIELGEQMEKFYAAYWDAHRRSQPNWEARRREINKWSGRTHVSNEEYELMHARVDSEYPIANPSCDDVMDACADTSERVLKLPARTLAGLKVKARLAKFTCSQLWDEPDDRVDWDELVLRDLIDAVIDGVQS